MFLLLGMWSCKTEQWAAKSQAVIHLKFPEMEARNCAERFPVKVDSVSHSDTVFKAADVSQYQNAIDSLRMMLTNDIPPLESGDSCEGKVLQYVSKLKALQRAYNNLLATPVPHDTIIVTQKQVVTKENTAAVAAERMAKEKAQADASKKASTNKALLISCIALFILFALSVVVNIKTNKKNQNG